jgi:hypothetical protein
MTREPLLNVLVIWDITWSEGDVEISGPEDAPC